MTNFFTRFLFVVIAIVLSFFSLKNSLLAQSPVSSTEASIVSLSVSTPFAERRAFSDNSPNPVFITATRTNTNGAAFVRLDILYRAMNGQSFTNTELQEDWGTMALSLNNMGTFTNFIFFNPGQSSGSIALFPIKVNFRRNPDRILTARLLPPLPNTGQQYSIAANPTSATVSLTLRDNFTASTQPFLLNAIQNTVTTGGSITLIEIETPTARADGAPGRVFINDRGSELFYSTTSFQPNVCRAEILTRDTRPNGLAALRLTADAVGRANIILVAVDSSNRAATSSFEVLVRPGSLATSVREASISAASIECSPNPASDFLSVKGLAVGAECRLISTQGQILRQWKSTYSDEIISLEDIPNGAYLLAFEHEGKRTVKTFVKN